MYIPRVVSSIFSSDHFGEGVVSSELIAAESPETGRVTNKSTIPDKIATKQETLYQYSKINDSIQCSLVM